MATGTPAPRYDFVCEPVPEPSRFRLLAETPLPTEHGDVTLYVYGDGNCSPWSVCVYGEVRGKSGVSMRLHDACLTSEVLGSVKCDCARQLRLAQRQLATFLTEGGDALGVAMCSIEIEGANLVAAEAKQEAELAALEASRAAADAKWPI